MKKLNKFIPLLIIILTLVSCIVDGSWLKIVGCWQDVEYPDMGMQFTKSGEFYDYFYGETVDYGDFVAEGHNITLHYLNCGDNGMSCTVRLTFTVTEDTLILTDSKGDFRFRRVNCP
jgi:hypothetical protein